MSWFSATLSLESEASLAIGKRKMRELSHRELQDRADQWLATLYTQHQIINSCMRHIQELEINIAMGNAQPIDHLALAREIEAELRSQQVAEPLRLHSRSRLTQRLAQWLQRLPFNRAHVTRAG
jgi:hypothetical protein